MGMFTVLAFLLVLCQKDVFSEANEFNVTTKNSVWARHFYYPSSYCNSSIIRTQVPREKVPWDVEFKDYNPPYYTAPQVLKKQFADDENIERFNGAWNVIHNGYSRISYEGTYKVVNGYPLNPIGRTGLRGRGMLSRWGPNLVASLIATKWKRTQNGDPVLHSFTKLPMMQALLIKTKFSSKWNLPITFVNPGESIQQSMQRVFFSQQVMNFTNLIRLGYNKEYIYNRSIAFFATFQRIYAGYTARPENTDNAWVETVALQYLDKEGNTASAFPIKISPNKADMFVRWVDVFGKNSFILGNHCRTFLKKTAIINRAHW